MLRTHKKKNERETVNQESRDGLVRSITYGECEDH
jgi:hypothetical protein